MRSSDFTQGKILSPLIKFALPVLFAMFLQSLYGAVDLMIVGQFADAANVSAVSTGSQAMNTVTAVIIGLSMGITILIGQEQGNRSYAEVGKTIGASIAMFSVIAVIMTAGMILAAGQIAESMNTPAEAVTQTVAYIKICSAGSVFIIAYNVIGSVFRGAGNANIPLITVAIASASNIIGDLILVAGFHMGAAGAALATVVAQLLSVVLSLLIVMKSKSPYSFNPKRDIRFNKARIQEIVNLGFPLALQDFLVSMSFLFIIAIVNSLGVNPSAGAGVATRLSHFIMLVPSSFSKSASAFVSQNYGARKMQRAFKSLKYSIFLSISCGIILFYLSFFHGSILAGIFSNKPAVIEQAADYLKGYAIDVLLTSFMFCFVGFFNGVGKTKFVMVQGIIGGVGIRIPLSYLFSKMKPVTLFHISLATPCSSAIQILLLLTYFIYLYRGNRWYSSAQASKS